MNNHNPELPSQKLSLGCAFRRGFFPTKVFFSAATLLDLVVLLTHVGGLTGGGCRCQQLVTSCGVRVVGKPSLVPHNQQLVILYASPVARPCLCFSSC